MKTNYLEQRQMEGMDSWGGSLPIDEENIQSPEDMINELLAAKESLESEVKRLQGELEQKDKEIAEWKMEYKKLSEITDVEKKADTKAFRFADKEMLNLQSTIQKKDEELAEVKRMNHALHGDKVGLKVEISVLNAKIAELEAIRCNCGRLLKDSLTIQNNPDK